MNTKHFALLLTLFIFIACGKDSDNDPVSTITVDFTHETLSDRVRLDASPSSSDSSEELTYKWETDDPNIFINNSNNKQAFFIIPDNTAEYDVAITLTVDDGKTDDVLKKKITVPVFNDHISQWGLGNQSKNRVSNDVDYDWYIDQLNTGKYNYENCGPSSVTMAIKWANKDFKKTASDARDTYRSNGGWWYTSDIIKYLHDNDIEATTTHLNFFNLNKNLDEGSIAILCLDMHLIRSESNSKHRIDKYYRTDPESGHFIVVKGYRMTDTDNYYEVYDPNSWGETYTDNALKGINRYYRESDILKSCQSWWNYAIIVSRTPSKTKQGIDPNLIEHAWGR
jgi:hypothetical protein